VFNHNHVVLPTVLLPGSSTQAGAN